MNIYVAMVTEICKISQKAYGSRDNTNTILATLMKLGNYVNRWQCAGYAGHLSLPQEHTVVAMVTEIIKHINTDTTQKIFKLAC